MKSSIQSKLLGICVLLVLITIIGISVAYYILIRQDKRREYQQRIQIAFDIILDDYEARVASSTNRVRNFIAEDTLTITTGRYLEDEERIQSISFVTTNLVKAAEELQRFGRVNVAQRVVLYSKNTRLLASYQYLDEQEETGMYVVLAGGEDVYLPIEDADQVTAMLLGRTAFSDVTVPEGILPSYEADFPDTVSATLFTENAQLGLRITAPIVYQDQVTGWLLADIYYTQSIVERYATLSQTDVNVFAGRQLSAGTLPEHASVDFSGEWLSCDALRQRSALLDISPVTIGGQRYYQGRCVLTDVGQQPLGAIVVHLSQEIEKQAIQHIGVAALYIVACVFALALGLSWVFSRRISRPIRTIAHMIHQISDGNLTGIVTSIPSEKLDSSEQTPSVASPDIQIQLPETSHHTNEDEIALLTHSFHALAAYLQSMATAATNISHGDVTHTIVPRSEHDTLGIAFQQMLAYIRDITGLVRDLAEGNLLVDAQPRSDQDILNHSLRKMLMYLQGVAHVAESVAEGKLQVHVQPKSELDVLNQALQRMVGYIQEVADITGRIANNEMQVAIIPKSSDDVLNLSLYRMVLNLQTAREKAEQSMAEVEQQNWLKTGQAELNDVMRGEQNVAMLARQIITYLAEYLEAQVGLLYVTAEHDGELSLQLAGSYAYATRKGHRNAFKFGEGLVGQAALEQQSLLFSELPEGYILITSGIGEMTPQNILVTPFIYDGEVRGVIELGTIHTFSELHREFLELACENIAIAMHTAQARVKMQQLLEETQRQSEVLQAQQEELRQSNVQLEARTRALQESEAKLQAQQEELRQSNAQLQAQAEALKASEEKLQAQQEELRQTNEELEANTKTLEKQQQVLQEKNRDLERSRRVIEEKVRELELANRYKSEFLANMSHELRTPLNSVLVLSKLLHENKEGNLTEKQKKSAHMIYHAVVSWIELIDDVLNLSELETGQMTVECEDVDTRTLVTFIEQQFRRMCEEKGLAFKIDLDEAFPSSLYTDFKRLEQIMKNLVSNAVKFTEHGEIRITLSRPTEETRFARSDLEAQQVVAIAVSDTGIGISEEKHTVIFEAFQQGDGTTTRQYGGTGLGLSIVQKLAERLGGEIQVHSKPGTGSTFTLYLPEQGQQVPVAPRSTPSPEEPASSPVTEQPAEDISRVLLVDADDTMRTHLVDLLNDQKTLITEVKTGQEAYRILQTDAFDLLLLDIDLADISGTELLEYLHHEHKLIRMPLIIYTAKELTKDTEMTLLAYTEHIILKHGPQSEKRLFDAVNAILQRPEPETSSLDTLSEEVENHPPHNAPQRKTILVVDDDVRNLYALSHALEGYGFKILMGIHGKEALEQLHEHPEIDLVVMDIMMPEMDGYEAMRAIRTHESFRELPIIALTAKAMKQEREKCLSAGANEYLTKPVDVEQFVTLLQVWLSDEKSMEVKHGEL